MKVASCPQCGMLHRISQLTPGSAATCGRCDGVIQRCSVDSLRRTLAFSLAALLLYMPANILPILHMDLYGAISDNTVWQGCVRLYDDGDPVVAIIVFLSSMVIPLCKLSALFFLTLSTRMKAGWLLRSRTWLYRAIELIGPWAMLDVFIVAILVSLVKLKKLATILPGPVLLSFTAVVVLTILASASFDPQAIWEPVKSKRKS